MRDRDNTKAVTTRVLNDDLAPYAVNDVDPPHTQPYSIDNSDDLLLLKPDTNTFPNESKNGLPTTVKILRAQQQEGFCRFAAKQTDRTNRNHLLV